MAGPCAEACTSMYLPILMPIGAIHGMFGYGSPASPGALLEPAGWARAPAAQAQMAATIRTARKNLRRWHLISVDIFPSPFNSKLVLPHGPHEDGTHLGARRLRQN